MYGELGKLTQINGRALCHICGRTYGHLGAHVKRTHGVEAYDYKKEFGLNAGTGLTGEDYAEKKRKHGERLAQYRPAIIEKMKTWTFEQRSAWLKNKETRTEAKLKPEFLPQRKKATKKANDLRHETSVKNMLTKTCPNCHKEFKVMLRRKKKIYCSMNCYHTSEEKKNYGKKAVANLAWYPGKQSIIF